MSYTNSTTNLKLPQFAETDIPTWDDVNDAFAKIDTFAGTVNQKLALLENGIEGISLKDFIKYSETGTGITSAQYSHLTVNQ